MRRVKYDDWEPVYHEICEYFSFDPVDDDRAAHILADLTPQDATDLLKNLIFGKPVTVCGNAPTLVQELDAITGVIIAADAASGVLIRHGIIPDVIVTDLDGIEDEALALNTKGTILVVHAHGDNIPRIQTWVPRMKGPLVLTTQGRPFDHVYNFGGFTDGDRAVYLAYEMQASDVKLVGFDLDDPQVTPMKKGKLLWARKLLSHCGHEL